MARILAVDWDGVEVRYALGSVFKDRLVISSVGDAPIEGAGEEVAAAVAETPDPSSSEEFSENNNEEGEGDGSEVVETVEKSYIPRMPVADDEEEEEEITAADPTVVSTVKKKKGESFKTSPIALTLKKLFRERRVGSATICYSAERADVDVMYMTLPNATDSETPELVFNQALRESLTFNETQPLDFTTLGLPETAKKTGFRRVVAVSIARDKLRRIRETLIGASRAPSKIELREPALAEILRTDFCGVNYDVPVMLIQELCDEVNLTLGYGKNILYFRSFKVRADSTLLERAERIRDEVVRTIAIGVDDLPEDAVVEKAVFFTNPPCAQVAENEDGEEDGAPETLGSVLSRLLAEEEITLDLVNPFRISGIKLKCSEPEHVGRYASLIGMLLAERPQARPSIDLLHPHEKPKPPNFTLLFLAYFLVVGILAGVAWGWNKKDLARLNEELDALTKERDEIVMNFNQKSPLANVLTRANNWQNREGVVVLDELRDIAARLPKSPDLVVTRLAYMASYTGSEQRLRNLPVFIISAKITGLEVYKLFENNMKLNGAHNVFSRGPVANPQGGGYKFMFEAFIVCQRRNQQSLLAAQSQEIRDISKNRPEYYVEQEEEKARLLKEAQEKKYGEIVDSFSSLMDQIAQEEPATPSLDQKKTFAQQLVTRRQNLQQQYASAGNLLRNNAISREHYNQLTQIFKENDAAIVKKWQETCSVINAEEEKIKREQAENVANAEPTLESDLALRQQLLAQRRQLDYAMQQEQIKLRNGAITQQAYESSLATYKQEVDKILAQWNPLMERMKQRQEAQGASASESTPAPESEPTPAPETPAAPAPESAPAPAPEAPAAPAPEPAPAPAARMEAYTETSLIALAERPVHLCSDLPDSSVKESLETSEGAVFFEQNC